MIYFDSAATTFQKPRTVADAMRNAMATMSSPGRGGYPAAMRAAEAPSTAGQSWRSCTIWRTRSRWPSP